jgi:hypothetical protein
VSLPHATPLARIGGSSRLTTDGVNLASVSGPFPVLHLAILALISVAPVR